MEISRIQIDPKILSWAITRAGKDIDAYTEKHKLVSAWLNEEKQPTFKQLEEFARKVYLPFGYLFLPTPPVEECPIPFFRNVYAETQLSLNVYDTVLMMQNRQDWLSEYLKENKFEPLPFVGAYSISSGINTVVDAIRSLLDLKENWASAYPKNQDALNALTSKTENNGIIISFNSVVGNNTSRHISVDECRGFSLVNNYAPFVFINSADSKTAQIFTLVHEIAHILIGFSAGISIYDDTAIKDENENFCDKVAAEFLVPLALFRAAWVSKKGDYEKIARQFSVSKLVIARRALECGLITKDDFFNFYNEYKTIDFSQKSKDSGGDFYRTAFKRISRTFAMHVNNAVRTNQLLYRDAYHLTGLNGNTFSALMSK